MLDLQRTIAMFLILTAIGCTSRSPSELLITNGVETTDYPDVVKIEKRPYLCTGTFVSPTTLITAAHCAEHGLLTYYGDVSGKQTKHDPKKVIIHPEYKGEMAPTDVAVVIYYEKIAPAIRKLGAKSPNVCDPVTIVGYGRSAVTKSAAGVKRFGENTVSRKARGFIELD